ncbi:LysR family transcriptional regulator [Microvirga sp. 17 mud 1-3]|nr:LysR family transcriptional regulator [Microvirga sp. 17 mud 1-3]
MADIERLQGLSAFVRVVEAGSFTGGARLLGTTPSAISKSIARLEQRLGVRLFHRSTRSFTLTAEGQDYFDHVAPLMRALEEASDSLRSGHEPAGRLRLSMPADLGRSLMQAITTQFLPHHPHVKLDVSLTDRHVDLIREGFDLTIRVGRVADTGLMSRSLGELPLVLVASPAYLSARGVPRSVDDLRRHAHVRYMLSGRPFPITFADGTSLTPEGVLDADSGDALRIAAVNGLGIAQILRANIHKELSTGLLSVVLPEIPMPSVPVQVLHAFGRNMPSRARVFLDFVAARINE